MRNQIASIFCATKTASLCFGACLLAASMSFAQTPHTESEPMPSVPNLSPDISTLTPTRNGLFLCTPFAKRVTERLRSEPTPIFFAILAVSTNLDASQLIADGFLGLDQLYGGSEMVCFLVRNMDLATPTR